MSTFLDMLLFPQAVNLLRPQGNFAILKTRKIWAEYPPGRQKSPAGAAAGSAEYIIERGGKMVEFDQFKYTLNGYQGPLVELRDSL